ncbi:hypothetical protein B0J15DRAFT_490812 [Fusarium solani]|uniref:Rhodopsin domain-containing protein n=1 Tax=Fusarium solani TaxID=169388 RepID=A0A9P9HW25_FUSSL|nr:uncharacterized protein B0J15DRAFT_490812 [Fusarium solani]KAH7264436.1 hypothetical protein B0J15DRAFT_490812 [Fusarium solani]
MAVYGSDLIAWSIGFYVNVLAMLFVMLRLWRRDRQMSANPSFYMYRSDIFMAVAYVLAIGNSMVVWPEIRRGSDDVRRSNSDFERLLLSKYLGDLLYTLSNGATKISITSFYIEQHHNLHPGRQDLVKAWRWATCWTVAFTWLYALQCQPFQKAWKADVEGMCINSTYVHILQMSSSMFLDLFMLGIATMFMLLTRTNHLELFIIVCAGLGVAAIDIYPTFMAATWADGLVRGTSYQGLIWPVIDLFMRIIYANTPFLYTVYMEHQVMKNPV